MRYFVGFASKNTLYSVNNLSSFLGEEYCSIDPESLLLSIEGRTNGVCNCWAGHPSILLLLGVLCKRVIDNFFSKV